MFFAYNFDSLKARSMSTIWQWRLETAKIQLKRADIFIGVDEQWDLSFLMNL